MSNINYHRYCDSITLTGHNKNTFLNQWYRRGMKWFNKRYEKEWENYNSFIQAYYEVQEAKGRSGIDIVADKEYKFIDRHYNPLKCHKFIWALVKIPRNIESWLCCGWKLHYNKEYHYWEYGEYHMMSKLCHRDAHITWWDKLRFKWITGYEYEEE